MSGDGGEEFRQRVRRVEALVEALEQAADPATRAAARELMATLLDLHRAGLARLLEAVGRDEAVAEACARDELVSSLLLLHGLHPIGLEHRVQRALDRLAPHLRAYGAGVELLGVNEGRVRLRFRGGRAPSGEALRLALEEAVCEAAPDAVAVEVEDDSSGHMSARVSLPLVGQMRRG